MFTSCQTQGRKTETWQKRSHPSHRYNYVTIDTALLKNFETDYLPVYSDIYFDDGTRRLPINVSVSLRNTSLTDSAYVLSAS
jgi:hypothetical protein